MVIVFFAANFNTLTIEVFFFMLNYQSLPFALLQTKSGVRVILKACIREKRCWMTNMRNKNTRSTRSSIKIFFHRSVIRSGVLKVYFNLYLTGDLEDRKLIIFHYVNVHLHLRSTHFTISGYFESRILCTWITLSPFIRSNQMRLYILIFLL